MKIDLQIHVVARKKKILKRADGGKINRENQTPFPNRHAKVLDEVFHVMKAVGDAGVVRIAEKIIHTVAVYFPGDERVQKIMNTRARTVLPPPLSRWNHLMVNEQSDVLGFVLADGRPSAAGKGGNQEHAVIFMPGNTLIMDENLEREILCRFG